MAEQTTNTKTTISRAAVSAPLGPRSWSKRALPLVIGVLVILAALGSFMLLRPRPAPSAAAADPASTVKRSPGTVFALPSSRASVQTRDVNVAQPSNTVKTQITPWPKVEQQRHDALIAWQKAEAARQERERQAALLAAQQAAQKAALARQAALRAQAAQTAPQNQSLDQNEPSRQVPSALPATPNSIGTNQPQATSVSPNPANEIPAVPGNEAPPPVREPQTPTRAETVPPEATPAGNNQAPETSTQLPAPDTTVPAITSPAAPANPDSTPPENGASNSETPTAPSSP